MKKFAFNQKEILDKVTLSSLKILFTEIGVLTLFSLITVIYNNKVNIPYVNTYSAILILVCLSDTLSNPSS